MVIGLPMTSSDVYWDSWCQQSGRSSTCVGTRACSSTCVGTRVCVAKPKADTSTTHAAATCRGRQGDDVVPPLAIRSSRLEVGYSVAAGNGAGCLYYNIKSTSTRHAFTESR